MITHIPQYQLVAMEQKKIIENKKLSKVYGYIEIRKVK